MITIFNLIMMYLVNEEFRNDPAFKMTFLFTLGFTSIILVGVFVVKAVAVCKMAKKRGMKNWWLGMIPYANFYVIGKLAGPIRMFRKDIKNMGLAHILVSALNDVTIIAIMLIELLATEPVSRLVNVVYTILYVVNSIISIAKFLSFYGLAYAIFGKYAPQRRLMYTLFSIFFEISFPFFLLAIMNNTPYANADDFYKEQIAKRYGQSYNPYQNPYNTSENPYINDKGQNESPFDDYAGNNDSMKNPENNGNNNDSPFDEF